MNLLAFEFSELHALEAISEQFTRILIKLEVEVSEESKISSLRSLSNNGLLGYVKSVRCVCVCV